MSQPRLIIEKDQSDKILEAIGLIVLALIVIIPIKYYNQLQEVIPSHFNMSGTADGYGHKSVIIILVGLSIIMYALLSYLSKIPHTFNYPTKITKENAHDQYRSAMKMMLHLKVIILLSFHYMIYVSIQNGLGTPTNLGIWFTATFIIGILGICFWPLLRFKK